MHTHTHTHKMSIDLITKIWNAFLSEWQECSDRDLTNQEKQLESQLQCEVNPKLMYEEILEKICQGDLKNDSVNKLIELLEIDMASVSNMKSTTYQNMYTTQRLLKHGMTKLERLLSDDRTKGGAAFVKAAYTDPNCLAHYLNRVTVYTAASDEWFMSHMREYVYEPEFEIFHVFSNPRRVFRDDANKARLLQREKTRIKSLISQHKQKQQRDKEEISSWTTNVLLPFVTERIQPLIESRPVFDKQIEDVNRIVAAVEKLQCDLDQETWNGVFEVKWDDQLKKFQHDIVQSMVSILDDSDHSKWKIDDFWKLNMAHELTDVVEGISATPTQTPTPTTTPRDVKEEEATATDDDIDHLKSYLFRCLTGCVIEWCQFILKLCESTVNIKPPLSESCQKTVAQIVDDINKTIATCKEQMQEKDVTDSAEQRQDCYNRALKRDLVAFGQACTTCICKLGTTPRLKQTMKYSKMIHMLEELKQDTKTNSAYLSALTSKEEESAAMYAAEQGIGHWGVLFKKQVHTLSRAVKEQATVRIKEIHDTHHSAYSEAIVKARGMIDAFAMDCCGSQQLMLTEEQVTRWSALLSSEIAVPSIAAKTGTASTRNHMDVIKQFKSLTNAIDPVSISVGIKATKSALHLALIA